MTTKGHNSGGTAQLKSIVDRIERLEEEKAGIGSDVRDVYTEAKGNGYNPKALRKLIAERKRKTDAELEADLEAYRAALGMPGATYRSVAEQLGASKSKLQRLVPRKQNGTEPDGDNGITNAAPQAQESDVPVLVPAPLADEVSHPQPAPHGGVGTGTIQPSDEEAMQAMEASREAWKKARAT